MSDEDFHHIKKKASFVETSDESFCNCSQTSDDYNNDRALLDLDGEYTPPSAMLVTGFGMRNVESLQRALLNNERYKEYLRKKYEKKARKESCSSLEEASSPCSDSLSYSTKYSYVDLNAKKSLSLNYLMGLEIGAEEHEEPRGTPTLGLETPPMPDKIDAYAGMTKAMKAAHRYLRSHRINEFFRFLTAHMLSKMPENPIDFLLELLEKCLIFRSGCGNPPLLYEKPHLEQLFYLMDRMRTGYIELTQYKTGMETLGITAYEQHPRLSRHKLVRKDTFVEEAYDCLTDMLIALIRTRRASAGPALVSPPPPSMATSMSEQ